MDGAHLIVKERERQISEEGWTAEHDDQHDHHQLLQAAIAYIMTCWNHPGTALHFQWWPWNKKFWKPSDPIRNLVKAGALIAAEIDRLQRINNAPFKRVTCIDCGCSDFIQKSGDESGWAFVGYDDEAELHRCPACISKAV